MLQSVTILSELERLERTAGGRGEVFGEPPNQKIC